MFGFSLGKLVVLAAIIAAVWYGFKFLHRLEARRAAQQKVRRGKRLKGEDDELFNGAFWTGRKALELGLVDGVGDMRTVLRDRFGKHVRLRLVQGRRSWLQRRLGFRTGDAPTFEGGRWAADLLAAVEERFLWSRIGL